MSETEKALVISKQADLIRSVDDLARVSQMLFKSGLLPTGIKSPEAAAATILLGREVGFPPMVSFNLINVIQGKPTVSPQGMLALIHHSKLLESMAIEDDGNSCKVTMKRKGLSAHSETFSMEDAKRMMTFEKGESIPLAQKYNWRQMPTVMRKWRAVSACARVVFPDLIAGFYLPEEMGAEVNEEGEFVTVNPQPTDPSEYDDKKEPEQKEEPRKEEKIMTGNQRAKLVELYRETRDCTEAEAIAGLDGIWMTTFKHEFGAGFQSEASEIIKQMTSAKPAKKHTVIDSADNNPIVLQIRATAKSQFAQHAGVHPTKEQTEKLAAVMDSALDERLDAKGKEEWRHAIYKRVAGVEHAKEMDGSIFAAMYVRWKDTQDGFKCNNIAKTEVASLMTAITKEAGQSELPL